MIIFPASEHTYTGQIEPAKSVIIDGTNCGDLFPAKGGNYEGEVVWRTVLTGRVARSLYGNGDFANREAALNYMRLVYREFDREDAPVTATRVRRSNRD